MNHQPCNRYLDLSTKLSRLVSLTTIHIETANVHLEDILLVELSGSQSGIEPIISSLSQVEQDIQEAMNISAAMRQHMDDLGYEDLSSLHSLDAERVGENLASAGLVEKDAWDKMSNLMKNGTFYANIRNFDASFARTVELVNEVKEVFLKLRHRAGDIHCIAEKNQDGNFKVSFARLLTHWTRFHAEFLASSLVSTEVYYASFGAGSLCQVEVEQKQVA